MKKVGIIGAGNMGNGVAQKTAQEGLSVVLVDVTSELAERGIAGIRATLNEAVERKILKPEQAEATLSRIEGTSDLAQTKDCDLVIEAVFEDMAVKKDLFARLDPVCGPGTILATNTSSFSVDELARATGRPDRFVGLHFFYHPAKNRLLEIIPGAMTSPETVAACRQFAQLTGKTDILVKDAPGFAVNRFFVPWLNEATRVLEEGIATIPTIDRAAMQGLGIGMGPFKLMNVTGIPIAYHSCESLAVKLGPFYAPSARLKTQFESGESWSLEGDVDEAALDKVSDRLMGAVFYVAASLLEEGVTDMTDIDLGAKVGLRWKEGPFEAMNLLGMEKAYTQVKDLLRAWPDLSMPVQIERQYEKKAPWDIRYVKYIPDGELGRVVLSRPDAMNALNETVVKQLDEAFQQAGADSETRAIVLEGAGKAFVAGADIGFFIQCIHRNRLDDNYRFTEYGQAVFNRIDDSEKPVVAKVDGLALGGGFELALAADIIAATPKAVMGFPETGIGIYPGLGGTQRTSRYIGKALTKYLVFTGRLMSADAALSIGLVDYVFAPEEIDEQIRRLVSGGKLRSRKGKEDEDLPLEFQHVRKLFDDSHVEGWLKGKFLDSSDPIAAKTAKTIAGKAPLALKLANQIIDAGYELPLKEGLKQELAHLHEIFSTQDALTGLSSVGKARPVFEGK